MRPSEAFLAPCLVAAAALAGPVDAAPNAPPTLQSMESFASVQQRLNHMRHAAVSSACGSAVAPWAYRGKRGRDTMLRPFVTDRADRDWSKRFIATLFREVDWDSVQSCPANSRPCRDRRLAPIFAVTLSGGGGEVYVTLHFDSRCAQVFQANHPLGTVHFGARADSVLALLKQALHSDRDVQAMTATPPIEAPTSPALMIADSSRLELPHVLSRVTPEYPEPARRRNVEGTVWIQALIGTDGTVRDAFTAHSILGLDGAALDAIWRWEFRPAKREGKPVAVWVLVPVRFSLR